MALPQHCRPRLPSPTLLLLLLELMLPTPTTSFLPAPLHPLHTRSTLHRSARPNLQDEYSDTSAAPSFWQRLFPSATPSSKGGEKDQEIGALAARLHLLEKQNQAELTVLRQDLEDKEQQHQQYSSKKQGLQYSGTWTVELTKGNYVHCTPTFDLEGFSFRMVLTEKRSTDGDTNGHGGKHVRLTAAGAEGDCGVESSLNEREEEKGGGRLIGLYLEYLPSFNSGGGGVAAAAVPCVQCRFKLLQDEEGEEGEVGLEEEAQAVYESALTFLDVTGGAFGLDGFTHVWSTSLPSPPPSPPPPPPPHRSGPQQQQVQQHHQQEQQQEQQQQQQQQQKSKLRVGFEVSLKNVHFLGATEQAQALQNAWAQTEAAVEEQVRAAVVREEESVNAAAVHLREEGGVKVEESFLFAGRERGEEGEKEGEEEEKEGVCLEDSCNEDNDDDESEKRGKKKEDESEEEEEGNEKEKEEGNEEVRAGDESEYERRRRENTGGREAEGEEDGTEEEAGWTDDEDDDDADEYEGEGDDEEFDEDEEEEEAEMEVKGA